MKQTHNNISSELTILVDSVNYVSGSGLRHTIAKISHTCSDAMFARKFSWSKSKKQFTELLEKANEYKMEQYCENMLSLNNIMDY